jgi:hypothetical protein
MFQSWKVPLNMFGFIFKYIFFSIINVVLFLLASFALMALLPETVVNGDTFELVYGLVFISFLVLTGFVVNHQITPKVGFIEGWKLGFLSVKMYIKP